MKTPVTTICSLLFGAVLLSSCERCENATITMVTEEDAKWLVYDGKDTIRFVNESNQPIHYIRTYITPENVPGKGYSVDDKCVEQLDTQVSNVIQDVKGKQPGLATYVLKRPDELTVKLIVEGRGAYEIDETKPTHASLPVNGKTYPDVFEIKKDSTANNTVKRILYNKQVGFISVEFYGGKKLIRK